MGIRQIAVDGRAVGNAPGTVRIGDVAVCPSLVEVVDLIVDDIIHGSVRQRIAQVQFRRDPVKSGIFHIDHRLVARRSLGVLGRDDDDAVGGLGAPDGGGGRIFQDGDVLDVVGVDRVEGRLNREAIDDDERRSRSGESGQTADLERRIAIDILRISQTRSGADQAAADVCGRFFDLRPVDDVERTGRPFLGDRLVTGHDDVVQGLHAFCQRDINHAAFADGHRDFLKTDAAETQGIRLFGQDGILAVQAGGSRRRCPVNEDRHAGDRIPIGVADSSADPALSPHRKDEHEAHQRNKEFLHCNSF